MSQSETDPIAIEDYNALFAGKTFVITIEKTGKTYEFTPDEYPKDIVRKVIEYGFGQKVSDKIASLKQSDKVGTNKVKWTGEKLAKSQAACIKAVDGVITQLKAGEWRTKASGDEIATEARQIATRMVQAAESWKAFMVGKSVSDKGVSTELIKRRNVYMAKNREALFAQAESNLSGNKSALPSAD